jgi:serpin B
VSNVSRADVSTSAVPNLRDMVAGMGAFAAHLHSVAATPAANFTMSPLSIAVAFGMLRAGSRGATGRQLDAVFGFPQSSRVEGSPHEALNALTAELVTPPPLKGSRHAPAPVVAIANALFVDDGFGPSVQLPFLDLLAAQYGAHPATVDFSSSSATQAINDWVVEQTRGRIEKLFDALDPATLMVLANAVYLKATWMNQFRRVATETQPFMTASGSTVRAPLMSQSTDPVPYSENDQWQRITLPYVGGELAMRVVLPRNVASGVPTLTSLLDVATSPVTADEKQRVKLILPRWDTATDLELLGPLGALGLTDAGDLSGIAPGVSVSQAIHRANITVDEEGSEAAAVTGIAVMVSAQLPPATIMRVDRPFVWAVVHEPTQTPVFVGHVVDPTT